MYPGPRHTSLLGRVLNLRRLLNEYRWELWLFIGIPTVVSLISVIYDWSGVRWAGDSGLRDTGAVTGLAAAVLLGLSYPWVRRLGRPMLGMLWRYSIAASVVVGAVWIVSDLLFSGVELDSTDLGYSLAALSVAGLLVRLWFAREASRISLAHAFLFIALTVATGSLVTPFTIAWLNVREGYDLYVAMAVAGSAAFGTMLVVTITLLSIWALTTFDVLERIMRRRVIVALLALGAFDTFLIGRFSHLAVFGHRYAIDVGIFLAGAVVVTLIILGLTYLVRVRPPTEPPTALDAGEDA